MQLPPSRWGGGESNTRARRTLGFGYLGGRVWCPPPRRISPIPSHVPMHIVLYIACAMHTHLRLKLSRILSLSILSTPIPIYLSIYLCTSGTIHHTHLLSIYLSTPQNIWNPAVRAPGESE
jgi:hypothetical protein